MRQPFTRVITTLIVAGSLFTSMSAQAEFIALEKNAEANQVRIIFTGSDEGIAEVSECQGCPLTLEVGPQTRFFHNGKEIRRSRVDALSGKAATVIYSRDGKQALKIIW